jgi:excisionase family DNA binding protein
MVSPLAERKLVKAKAVAERLGVTERQVCQMASDHELPGYKVGRVWRFDPADVEEFLARHRTGGAA